MSVHTCHADGCSCPCPPVFLFCRPCWLRTPNELQRAVLDAYGTGHPKRDGFVRPTRAWFDAVRAAKASLR